MDRQKRNRLKGQKDREKDRQTLGTNERADLWHRWTDRKA